MFDAFRLGRRAAGVEQKEQVFGVHRLGLALRRLARDDLLPPIVAALVHEDVVADAARDDAVLDRGRMLHSDVAVALERHLLAAPPAVIGGNQRDALRVVDAIDDRFRAEAAEDHRMRGADPGAGEHRHGQLGNHRHVNRDAIAATNAELAQRVGEAADVVEQLLVRDRPTVAGLAFIVVGDLVAASGANVTVQAVDRHVELSVAEPAGERLVPFQRRGEGLAPFERARPPGPKGEVILRGLFVNAGACVGLLGKLGRRRKAAVLFEEGFDRGAAHRRELPRRTRHACRSVTTLRRC